MLDTILEAVFLIARIRYLLVELVLVLSPKENVVLQRGVLHPSLLRHVSNFAFYICLTAHSNHVS